MVEWQGIVIHHSASPRGFWVAGKRNYTAIGVCLVGNFQYDTVSPIQLQALVHLVKKLQKEWIIPLEKVELHNQVPGSKTLCPGRFFPQEYFYQLLAKT